jgi:hypothetical protein
LDIGRQLARWADDDGDTLDDRPAIPNELNDRQADFAVPLLAIAEQAGGAWPAEARAALVQLLAEGADRASDDAILLLHDLHQIFDADLQAQVTAKLNGQTPSEPWLSETRQALAREQVIGSELLVEQLNRRKESPWATMENGRALTQHKLARLLRDFDIRPGYVGPENDRKRGYHRLQFTGSWEAYLRAQDGVFSPAPPDQSVQTVQPEDISGDLNALRSDLEGFQSVQPAQAAHFAESARSANSAGLAHSAQSAQSDSGLSEKKRAQGPESPAANDISHNQSANFSLQDPIGNDFSAGTTTARTPPSGQPQESGSPPQPGPDTAGTASVATMVRLMAATHPEWTDERLAKQSGQPVSVVRRALARKPRNSPPGVLH